MVQQWRQTIWGLAAVLAAVLTALLASALCQAQAVTPKVILPTETVSARELAVIVNQDDPLSIQIARYYQRVRGIAAENMIYINFDPDKTTMHPGKFAVLRRQVSARTPVHIQAYLLTWAEPYRVGCMSISAAFAFGYDIKYCAKGCKTTYPSPYFNSNIHKPYDHYGLRPTMLLAADNFVDAKALIDRGFASDGSKPAGSAYLLETSDRSRSVRKAYFPAIKSRLGDDITLRIMKADAIHDRKDVMFYFTGHAWVDDITSNNYLPGAIADHLTSAGGQLTGGSQMSAMRWLQAGATGSYGTVVEPCNLTGKFPNPLIVMTKYLRGESLVEAYWKSVQMPGQGVFIGDPLATPYGRN